MQKTSLHISLPASLRAYVEARVSQAGYSTPSEYLRTLIRDDQRRITEQERETGRRLAALRKEIDIGLKQIEQGQYTEYDDHSLNKLVDQVKAEGRKRLAQRRRTAG